MCTWRKSGMLAFSWVQLPHKKQWLTGVTNAQLLEKLRKNNNARTRIENIQKRKTRTIDFNPWWYHLAKERTSLQTGNSKTPQARTEGRQQYGRKGNKAMGETQEEIFGSYFPPILFSWQLSRYEIMGKKREM